MTRTTSVCLILISMLIAGKVVASTTPLLGIDFGAPPGGPAKTSYAEICIGSHTETVSFSLTTTVLPPCDPVACGSSENLFCYGNFQSFVLTDLATSVNDYYDQMDLAFCDPVEPGTENTPDIVVQGFNQYVRLLYSGIAGNSKEPLIVPLSSPVYPGCQATISFRHQNSRASTTTIGSLQILGSQDSPCFSTGIPDCNNPGTLGDYRCIVDDLLVNTFPAWQNFGPFVWQNNGAEPVNFLLFYSTSELAAGGSYYVHLDDIVVTANCAGSISITPQIVEACADTEVAIEYQICYSGPQNPPPSTVLHVDLPNIPGMFIDGGDFDGFGNAAVIGPSFVNNCVSVTLNVNTESSPLMNGQTIDFKISAEASGACAVVQQVTLVQVVNCLSGMSCRCVGQNAINIDEGPEVLLSTLVTQGKMPGVSLFNRCLAVKGRLIIDQPYLISGCEIKMQPGSHILINNNVKVQIYYSDDDLDGDGVAGIHGCDTLWQGITVTGGSTLFFYGNKIQDAVYAVEARNGSALNLLGNVFDRNHVGVFVPEEIINDPFSQSVNQAFPAIGNTFDCTAPLYPGFTGQTVPTGAIGRAGMELNNLKLFQVGANFGELGVNTFSNMHSGILANSMWLIVRNARIAKMNANPSDPLASDLGIGIYGLGSLTCENTTMNYLERGIYGAQASLNARGNTIGFDAGLNQEGTVETCMDLVSYPVGEFRITGANRLSFTRYGIRIKNAYAAADIYILGDNRFTLMQDPSITGVKEAVSISDGGTNLSAPNYWIKGNIFEILDEGNGIALHHNGGFNVQDNAIFFSGLSLQPQELKPTGILINGSRNTDVYGNTILSDGNQAPSCGIRVIRSIRNNLCCNEVELTSTGVSFAQDCSEARLRHTIFDKNQVGLVCEEGPTRIGIQQNAGNQWVVGSFSQYAAAHFSPNPLDVQFSQFFVAPPPGTAVWPTNVFVASGVSLFFTGNVAPECLTDTECPDPSAPAPPPILHDKDVAVAKGELLDDTYGLASDWEARRDLYDLLKENPSQLGVDPDVDLFYQQSPGSTLAKLWAVDQEIAGLYPADALIQNLTDEQNEAVEELNELDSLFYGVGAIDSLDYIQQRAAAVAQAEDLGADLAAQVEILTQNRLAAVPGILADNADMVPEHILAANQKTVNRIYLETIAQGVFEASAQQLIDLRAVAQQCPNEGGQGVYRARAVLQALAPAAFDDEVFCAPNRPGVIPPQLAGFPVADWQVFPNPAREETMVYLPEEITKGTTELFDVQGISMRSWRFSREDGPTLPLNLEGLPRGIYWLRLTGDSTTQPRIQKLIIY